MDSQERIQIIDGLRFLAAMSVVAFHLAFRVWCKPDRPYFEYPVIGQIAQYGYLGVDLFFMISGFVILMTASRGGPANFLRSRAIRLYPAYWVAVIFTALSLAALGGEVRSTADIAINMTMLQSFVGIEHVDGSYWTLVIELHFYALMLLVLLVRQIERIDWILAGWLALSVAVDFIPDMAPAGDWFAAQWSHYFVAGAIAYRVRSSGLTVLRAMVFGAAYLQACRHGVWYMALKERLTSVPHEPAVMLTVIATMFLLFASLAVWRWDIKHRWLPACGALTYPLYLVHGAVGTSVLATLVKSGADRWLSLAAVTAASVAVAAAVHYLAERPVSRRIKSLLWAKNAAGVSSSV